MKRESGFTLIELVIVIVILGILAATALPKFIDLRAEAATAATDGVAGAINSAFVVNHAGYIANTAKGVRISATDLACSAAASSVLQGGLPADYSVAGTTGVGCSGTAGAGATFGCTVSRTETGATASAAATLICTG